MTEFKDPSLRGDGNGDRYVSLAGTRPLYGGDGIEDPSPLAMELKTAISSLVVTDAQFCHHILYFF